MKSWIMFGHESVFPCHSGIMRNLTPSVVVVVIYCRHLLTHLHVNTLVLFDNVHHPLRIYKRVPFRITSCVSYIQMRTRAISLHTTLKFKQEGATEIPSSTDWAAEMRRCQIA
jgi:hypothetical protein